MTFSAVLGGDRVLVAVVFSSTAGLTLICMPLAGTLAAGVQTAPAAVAVEIVFSSSGSLLGTGSAFGGKLCNLQSVQLSKFNLKRQKRLTLKIKLLHILKQIHDFNLLPPI